LVVTLLVGGLVGLLLLNTALQRGAYTTTALRERAAALEIRQQQLEVRVDQMGEPQRLARRAVGLGMVADSTPGYLELSTGRIVGTPAAGKRSNRVDVSAVEPRTTRQSGKVQPLLAGAANSLSSGAVVVADPTKGRQGHHAQNASGSGGASGAGSGVQYGGEAQGPNR
jgi:hypothetical protein